MRMALEALEYYQHRRLEWDYPDEQQSITALRDAMAEPQEPVSVTELQAALVETNLIDPDALFDPDGYDNGVTLERVDALHGLLFKSQRPAKPDTDCHAQGICQRTGYSIK